MPSIIIPRTILIILMLIIIIIIIIYKNKDKTKIYNNINNIYNNQI
jgi:hypothetical protein